MTAAKHGPCVGILANPAAGRDIRRLVAQASVFPIAEKRNMITRVFSALGAVGVAEVLMMPDVSGIADRVRRSLEVPPLAGQIWPRVRFLDMEIDDGPEDTLVAVGQMVEAGAGAIIVLGGDGTNRLVARACDAVPLVSLSTGTNNVFPAVREATIAGVAAGLVATGQVSAEEATVRNKVLRVALNGTVRDLALVDLCTSDALWTGSKALWRAEGLDQLFVAFAESDAIGLSAVAGLARPVSRQAAHGLRVDLAPAATAETVFSVPLAPGIITDIGVAAVHELLPGEAQPVRITHGVIALDGEREIEFSNNDAVSVRLDLQGPYTVEIGRVMALAAEHGLLKKAPGSAAAVAAEN
jgi:predicted polyphosphate/ATP-dependent NAD kinase